MNKAENAQLAIAREEIDKLDLSIWSLLEKRFTLAKEIAEIKSEFQLPILDEKREQDVLTKIAVLNCDPEIRSAIAEIYKLLFDLSKKHQSD